MKQLYVAREKGGSILSYVDFSNLCHVIKYFPELNKKLGKKKSIFLYPQVQ